MLKFKKKSNLELFIERLYPHHLNGYNEGWLEIVKVPFLNGEAFHIFTYENGYKEIVGTFIS